ncbi:MAG TPA: substrate-binding domain-containing protein [Chthoniobacter sp.]
MKSFTALLTGVAIFIGGHGLADPPVRVQATPSLMALAKDLVRPLHEQGIEIKVLEEEGNAQVIAGLGEGQIDAALITRPLNVDERFGFPARHFVEKTLGLQAVAVVVSRAVWQSGVHALKRGQIMEAYENHVRSWKELGGEDRPLLFFEPAHDLGPWEIFASWLYGDIHKAPAVAWQVVADGADTQTALQFASGGISVAGIHWADRKDVFPLILIDDSGKPLDPTMQNIASGAYPLTRPVIIAFNNDPTTDKRKLLDFLLSEKGQSLVVAHDFLPQSSLPAPAPAP